MVLVQIVGAPLVGKRETLLVLARKAGKKIEAFELQAPPAAPWPALSVHGLAVVIRDNVRVECFSGGVPPNAEMAALGRADALVLALDSQAGPAQTQGRSFFDRNREAILTRPRIYQITKADLAPDPRIVDPKDFGQSEERVIETNLRAGTGFDAVLAEILKLAERRRGPSP